ncbi:hypothetical protein G7Z17_g9940 [Cylindrodendrum hubeiense]|uniref:Uncharacterized protein n=1 Tax=Cylindrodendrum hubeiense TaxID=595255 RepID=A0A9P5H6V9_9HYPO|nr:hypothetical protein G7Z17_g9940 [Cylindrodendrum hubeiense]
MRSSYIATAAIVVASGLSQARVVPSNSKRGDDYTNEVVVMVNCNRMQEGSDSLYGTKSQMWWWSDYDAVFTNQEAVSYETAYVYAPGQDNPTYVDWKLGTSEAPITSDLNGETFELYKQAETGDKKTHVTGTGQYGGNDFTCYDSPTQNFHEPVMDGVEYVCYNKYLCTRSSREITRTEIEISEGTYEVFADSRYPMENPGIIEGYTVDEAKELSRAWAEKMYHMLIEAESSGTDADEPYSMGNSDHSMYFNIDRTEKEGDAHWDANRVTAIANALGSQIPPNLMDGSHADCFYNPKSSMCSWVLPFPALIVVKFEVAKQNDPRWITQDRFTISVRPDDGGSCSTTNAVATAIAGSLAAFVGYSVPAFGAAISTFVAGAVCL